MPSLGYSTYFISLPAEEPAGLSKEALAQRVAAMKRAKAQDSSTIENNFYQVSFTDGYISSIVNKKTGQTAKV